MISIITSKAAQNLATNEKNNDSLKNKFFETKSKLIFLEFSFFFFCSSVRPKKMDALDVLPKKAYATEKKRRAVQSIDCFCSINEWQTNENQVYIYLSNEKC